MEWYYVLGAIVYGIFIVQFILSWIGGDLDVDVDFDSEPDFTISDLVSFKGLIHFLMGLTTYLGCKGPELLWYHYLIAAGVGLMFVCILYYIYKLLLKLESKPKILSGRDLIGRSATVYLPTGMGDDGYYSYIITCDNNNGTIELRGKSIIPLKAGDVVTIESFINNYYIVI